MVEGIRPAKKPMEGGFSLDQFAPSLDAEAGESLAEFLEEFEGTKSVDHTKRNP